jgi:lysyl-tRNA synthetase class 1
MEVRRGEVPPEAAILDGEQRAFLRALADAVAAVGSTPGGTPASGAPAGGDAWQATIFATAAALDLPAGRAFAALYLAFLGRPNGPRAGWLLASLDPDFVVDRARAASVAPTASAGGAS